MIGEGVSAVPPKGEKYTAAKKEQEGSLTGRALKKGGAGSFKIIAVPLYIAAQTPRSLTLAAKPISAASRVIAGGLVAVGSVGAFASRSIKWVLSQAHKRGVIESTSSTFKNLLETTTRRADVVVEAKREQNATVTRGGVYLAKKVIGLIPVAGDLAEMALDGAIEADRIIQETDRAISRKATGGAKSYLYAAADAARIAGPLLLKGGVKLAETTEKVFETVRDKSWTVYQGKGYGIGALSSDLADILTGWTLDLAHLFDEECLIDSDIEEVTHISPEDGLSHITQNENSDLWKNFETLSRQEKADLFFLVSISRGCNLDEAQKQLYADSLNAHLMGLKLTESQQTSLKELVGMFDLLEETEKSRLTPHTFQAQDNLKKIQLYQLVRENAQNLTFEEGALLNKTSYRKIRTAAQWDALPLAEKNDLEYLVARLFNTLPQAVKEQRHNITPLMCLQLNQPEQQYLFENLDAKVAANGSGKDKKQWAKISCPFSHDHAQIVVNMFAKHLTKEEKFVEWSQLQGGSCVFAAGLSELDTLIKTSQNQLKQEQLKKPEDTAEIARLKRLINTLKNEKRSLTKEAAQIKEVKVEHIPTPQEFTELELAAAKPLDVEAIMQRVGPHIISDSSGLTRAGALVGEAVGSVGRLPGLAGWIIARAIGKVCAEELYGFGIGEGFQITARTLEILLSTEFGIQIFNSTLLKLGVPLAEIDKLLALGPDLVGKGILSIQGIILQTAQKSLDTSNSFLSSILTVHEQLALRDKLPEVQQQLIGAYAKFGEESKLTFGTSEYWKALEEFFEEQKVLEVPSFTGHVVNTVEEGGSLVGTILSAPFQLAKATYRPLRWVASKRIDVDKFERAGAYYYQAATENVVADTLRWGVKKAGSAVRSLGEGIQMSTTATPTPLQMQMASLAKEFATLIQQKNEAANAIKAIEALAESNIGAFVLLTADNEVVKAAAETMKTTINPTLQFAIRQLQAMHNMALGNHEFLASHLGELKKAPNSVLGLLSGSMAQLESGASEKLAKDNSWTTAFLSSSSYIAPIASNTMVVAGYLYGGSWSNYCLTALVAKNLLPPILRTIGPMIKKTKPFWYGVAEQSLKDSDTTGKTLKDGCTSIGGWFQRIWNMQIGTKVGFVDPKRAENFAALDPLEEEHLIQLVLHSDKCSPSERDEIIDMRAALKGLDDDELKNSQLRLGNLVLRVIDRMTKEELIWLSPFFYQSMDERTKIRIIDVVEKYYSISEAERGDIGAIVSKFNTLKPEQKAEIDQLQVSEYRQLTLPDQKGICYRLALIEAQKNFSEPSIEGGGLIFNPHAFAIEHYNQFKRIENMDNQQLSKLLPSITDSPVELISQLYTCSDAKVQHCYELVRKYNSAGVYTMKDEGLGDLRLFENKNTSPVMKQKLFPQLAILFNQLEPHQKNRFLKMTEDEALSLQTEDLHRVVAFLLSRPELSAEREALKKYITKSGLDLTYIAEQFNGLEPLVQAEFREKSQLGAQAEERLFATVKEQVEKLQTKLRLIEARSAELQTKEYLAYHHKTGEYRAAYLQVKLRNIEAEIIELERGNQNETVKELVENRKIEHKKFSDELATIQRKNADLQLDIDPIIAGIGRLEREAATIRSELQALGNLFDETKRKELGIIQDPSLLDPERKMGFDVGIEAALKVDKESLEAAMLMKLKEIDPINPIGLENAITSDKVLITNKIKVLKDRKQSSEQLIASHQAQMKELEQLIQQKPLVEALTPDERIRKLVTLRIELLVLKEFYLPLYEKLIKADQEYLESYDAKARAIMNEKKAEALGTDK